VPVKRLLVMVDPGAPVARLATTNPVFTLFSVSPYSSVTVEEPSALLTTRRTVPVPQKAPFPRS